MKPALLELLPIPLDEAVRERVAHGDQVLEHLPSQAAGPRGGQRPAFELLFDRFNSSRGLLQNDDVRRGSGQFGKHHVPRWVDEGIAVLSEPALRRLRRLFPRRSPRGQRSQRKALLSLAATRLRVEQQIAVLTPFQRLFRYWHVLHLPIALVMFAALAVHVTVAFLFGYGWPF